MPGTISESSKKGDAKGNQLVLFVRPISRRNAHLAGGHDLSVEVVVFLHVAGFLRLRYSGLV